jgi:imidazoleglycerol-phosphate dehydratase
MRIQKFNRKTKETEIKMVVDPDLTGKISTDIDTGLPFFSHLLKAMSFHGQFNLQVEARGDLEVDGHHLVEDIGLVLGEVLKKIQENSGMLKRFGHAVVPMDEALSEIAIDVCGRPTLVYEAEYPQTLVGNFDLCLLREFLMGLSDRAKISLHADVRRGINSHHMAESLFKALGRALKEAYTLTEWESMSTKGTTD